MALLDFLGPLLSKLKVLLGPLGKLYDKLVEGISHIKTILERSQTLVGAVVDEWNAWKNFKEDIRLRQRVIQLESAIKKTRDLVTGLRDAWNAVVDLGKSLKDTLKQGADSEQALEDAKAVTAEEESGADLITRFLPKLGSGLEKAFGVLALIVDALEKISNAIDDLQTILDEAKRIRLEIEKLDTIFLNQGNKRKTLVLEDGSKIRVRIGHLHPA